ncbi:hypothetical protein HYQ44_013979 [Verticillium longisporum]|nr:hypothetical protein HYQ44_013979 [Verticillium longisporum]
MTRNPFIKGAALALSLAAVSIAQENWNQNLVLADCGIGTNPENATWSTSRQINWYHDAIWPTSEEINPIAPDQAVEMPYGDGKYPWNFEGASAILPNGDLWSVWINDGTPEPERAGRASSPMNGGTELWCYTYRNRPISTAVSNSSSICVTAFICNHLGTGPTPWTTAPGAPVQNPPPAPPGASGSPVPPSPPATDLDVLHYDRVFLPDTFNRWESDYNGSRWFYRYKPTGQMQFHFPQDGDEFPDFVDANAPAPDLAPEEKLESQQQVKRKTEPSENNEKGPAKSLTRATAGPSGGGLGSGTKPSRTAAGKQQLSPTDDDDNGGEFYYQPESFMFLGPGAYSDVSPLGEEDDRVDAGAKPPEKGRRNEDENAQVKSEDSQPSRLSSKVSPIQSESTTPLVVHSTPVAGDSPAAKPSVETTQPAAVVEPPSATSPTVPLLDSREMPHELPASSPWSPVGVVAEMPTEHTAQARIESHPDPVEMGDSAVLAPIETHMDVGIAELPEHTTPTDRKPVDTSQHDELQQTSLPDHVLYQATFGTIARPKNPSPPSLAQQTAGASTPAEASTRSHERQIQAAEEPRAPRNESPFRITRKPTNAATSSSKYQPYAPPVAASTAERPHLEQRTSSSQSQDRRGSLIREGSLMLGPREPARVQSADVPTVLQHPQLPPKVEEQPRSHPSQAPVGSNTVPHHTAFAAREQTRAQENESGASSERAAPASLSHVPSVLKPARGKMIERSSTDNQRGHTDNPPRIGQIHHTTTMDVDPQPALGPRPWVQRVSTAPPGQQLQSPPSSSTSRTNDFSIPSPPPPRSYEASQSRDWSSESLAYQRQVVSTPQGRLPRQQSFASSDVSSLGPSSSRQSSIGNLQTPSPPESLQRRSSNISGFFADVDLGEERSTNPPSASRVVATEPFPSYAPPVREPVTRPASFAGSSSSPTHIPQDASDGTAPKPPKIPLKIPLEHKTDKEQPESDQGRSSSQPVIPISRQLPIPLPQPGQFDRAATTLPQTMDVRPQLYCRLRSQGCSRKEHCQKWEVSRVIGPVVDKEKEKERGGWFSKFKKGSQKYSSSLCNRNATPRKKCCPSTTRICHLMHNLLDRFLTARKTPRSHSQVPFGASTRTRWTCLLQLKCEFLTSTVSWFDHLQTPSECHRLSLPPL